MSEFNLGKFINKVASYSLNNPKVNGNENMPKPSVQGGNFSQTLNVQPHPGSNPTSQPLPQNVANNMPKNKALINRSVQMNHLESLEKALYVKDLMNLPKDLSTLIQSLQKHPAGAKNMPAFLNNINLSELAVLLQQNGKEAMNKLIFTMANASKQGLTDTSQLKDIMKLINASISTAAESNANQTLKSLMLLYLPWLPLQDGTGFELEVSESTEEKEKSDSCITILISTKNFGNIQITIILSSQNCANIIINCSEDFPKDELLKRLKAENSTKSLQSNIMFEKNETKQKGEGEGNRQAKVNVSNSNEINPYLLLLTNALIKYTIELDIEAG